jgi:hypothetical protein
MKKIMSSKGQTNAQWLAIAAVVAVLFFLLSCYLGFKLLFH